MLPGFQGMLVRDHGIKNAAAAARPKAQEAPGLSFDAHEASVCIKALEYRDADVAHLGQGRV